MSNDEQVNHPAHYGGDSPYEVIKVLEAWMTPEEFVGGLKFNILKYNARAGRKGDAGMDYQKAQFYQNYLVDYLQRQQQAVLGMRMRGPVGTTVIPGNHEPKRDNRPGANGMRSNDRVLYTDPKDNTRWVAWIVDVLQDGEFIIKLPNENWTLDPPRYETVKWSTCEPLLAPLQFSEG